MDLKVATPFERVVEEAIEIRQRAYAPYSKFRVGAAVLLQNQQIITGVNVENCSYGLSLCAERTALVSAIAKGAAPKRFLALAIAVDSQAKATPCGACRQVIAELCHPDMPLFVANLHDASCRAYVAADLLPEAFLPEALLS